MNILINLGSTLIFLLIFFLGCLIYAIIYVLRGRIPKTYEAVRSKFGVSFVLRFFFQQYQTLLMSSLINMYSVRKVIYLSYF
jgi:hypothetical protein